MTAVFWSTVFGIGRWVLTIILGSIIGYWVVVLLKALL